MHFDSGFSKPTGSDCNYYFFLLLVWHNIIYFIPYLGRYNILILC